MEKHFFKSLEIENFRGIKSAKIKDFARINCFVGDNGCGKTTVLESLFLLCAISDPGNMIRFHNFKGITLEEGGQLADLFFERLHEEGLSLVADQGSGKRTLRVNPVYGGSSLGQESDRTGSVSGIEEDGKKKKWTSMESSAGNSLLGLKYKFSVSDNGNETPKEYNSRIVGRFFPPNPADFSQLEIDDEYNETLSVNFILQGGHSPYNPLFIDRMIEEKRKDILLRSLKSVEDKIKDIKVGPTGIVSADIGYDKFIPVNLLGNGVRQILDVISKIDDKRNGVLMIDEIGNGLHVSSVEHLWKFLIEQSKECGTQIFMTTHSLDIIEALSKFYKKRECSLFPEDEHAVACFHLSKNAENYVKGFRYSPDQLMQVLESDTDIR